MHKLRRRISAIQSHSNVTALSIAGVNQVHAAIASTGEGYPFSTNLDTDPPVGGLAPKSQQQLIHEGLENGWTAEQFNAALDAKQAQRGMG